MEKELADQYEKLMTLTMQMLHLHNDLLHLIVDRDPARKLKADAIGLQNETDWGPLATVRRTVQ